MAASHGSKTVFKLAGVDLSAFCNTSEIQMDVDIHDITGYGATGHAYQGGLLNDKITVGGTYDTGPTGARKVIVPARGSLVAFIHQPEGTGSGKPQDAGNVIVGKYNQSHPVADMVKWTLDLTVSGAITSTTQP